MDREENNKLIYSGKYPLPLDNATKKSYKLLVYRSTIKCGNINNIDLPELPENYKIITYKDLPGKNFIKLEDFKIPLLAKGFVNYVGEPILLIVGPKISVLKSLYKDIKITYEETIDSEEVIFYEKKITIGNSDIESKINNHYRSLAGSFNTPSYTIDSKFPHGSFTKRESEQLICYTYTNWSSKLIQNIKMITDYNENNINIFTPIITGEKESSILESFIATAFTSVAANIVKKNMLYTPTPEDHYLYSPPIYGVSCNWKLNFNKEEILNDIEVNATIDCGAYPIFVQEKVLRVIHAIMSYYKHRKITVYVKAIKSYKPPCGVSEDLYQSDGLYISEMLNSKIIRESGKNNLTWREENLLKKGYKNSSNTLIRRELPLAIMLNNIAMKSDFLRKNSSIKVSNIRNKQRIKHSTKRGIGISTGYFGNCNISNTKDLSTNTVSIKLDKNNQIDIFINYNINNLEMIDIWIDIISTTLDIEEENITINYAHGINGPNIDSKNINILTPLIKQCCDDIKIRRFKDPLPIVQSKTTRRKSKQIWDPDSWKGTPFKNSSFAACAVEVEINKRDLSPVIKQIWIEVEVGKILNKTILIKTIYRDIINTINWLSQKELNYNSGTLNKIDYYNKPLLHSKPLINIYVNESGKAKQSAKGLGSLVKNTLPAAYIQGVSQALAANISSFPVTKDQILSELLKDEN